MENQTLVTGFSAISRLYLKITNQFENVITDDEIELFIGSMDKSNLEMVFNMNNAE